VKVYQVTMLQVPMSFNEFMGLTWPKQRREKEQWIKEFWGTCQHVPKHLKKVELYAKLYFRDERVRDSDNFSMPFWKFTRDGMMACGIIDDDNHRVARGHEPEIIIDRAKAPMSEIFIHVVE